jgi:hypothetical protein
MREIRTAKELWKAFYLPVRRGIRTQEEIDELFEESSKPEIVYIPIKAAPFERIVYGNAEIYSDQGEKQSKWAG